MLDSGQDGFDQGCFRQDRSLPVADEHLAKSSGRPKNLTRDSHHDHVWPALLVRVRADDDGRSLLRGGLIGKRKWDQNDVAEAIGGRSRHRQSCPKRRGMLPRIDAPQPA